MPEQLVDVARSALLEITSAESIGAPAGETEEGDGVVSVLFDSNLSGYPGWFWTVSIATAVDGPSVLEVELMPAEGALLAPDWVPWSERLADYKAAQEAAAEGSEESDDSDSDSDSEEDDDELDDDSDDDEPGADVVHAGDVDGVDIDELDDDPDDSDDSDEE